MKRIKEYINNHPKLKKTFKILGIVGVIFSFGFNILIIGAVVFNQSKSNNDNNINEITRNAPVKRVGYYDNDSIDPIYYYFQSDLVSNSFATNFFLNMATSATYYARLNPYNLDTATYVLNRSTLNPSQGTSATLAWVVNTGVSNSRYAIQQYVISKLGAYDYDNLGHYLCTYKIELQNENGSPFVTLVYRIMANLTDAEPHDLGIQCVTSECTIAGSMSSWFSWCIVENSNETNVLPFTDWWYKSQPQQNDLDLYKSGYENGKDYGYTNGYDYGYQVGYTAGRTGISNNPFDLITNAFSSIASILNIQILPNLTLGVLLFTPIIITIIIVIVKMVRG